MTYSQLWEDAYRRIGGEAYAFCRYLFDRTAPDLKLDKSEADEQAVKKYAEYMSRVENNEPMQYIFGYMPFYNIDIDCAENVLIPRYDTETVVEEAIKTIPHNGLFADICCGSGCIAAAVLYNRPDLHACCYDVSDDALALTDKNVRKYGLQNRCRIEKFNVFDSWDEIGVFDCIISNPPYIRTAELAGMPENVKREPALALDGGADGLDFYRRIICASKGHFRKERHIIFEIGYDQAKDIQSISGACTIKKDLSGNDRAAIIRG